MKNKKFWQGFGAAYALGAIATGSGAIYQAKTRPGVSYRDLVFPPTFALLVLGWPVVAFVFVATDDQ